VLFVLYIILLIGVTLVFFRGAPYARIELDPIASYRRAAAAPSHLAQIEIRNIILNIIMFIPMGLMPPLIWRRLSKIYIVLPIALAATLAVEFAQFLTVRGVFALEDIMHNFFGALLGFLMYKLIGFKRNR
jgi:glycopeptide antibiotics resistance protein